MIHCRSLTKTAGHRPPLQSGIAPINGRCRAVSQIMSRLTEKTYWDSVHVGEQKQVMPPALKPEEIGRTGATGLKANIKNFLGRSVLERISNYDDYLLTSV